jgi:hypothetical protein
MAVVVVGAITVVLVWELVGYHSLAALVALLKQRD